MLEKAKEDIVFTNNDDYYGITKQNTKTSIIQMAAFAFLYLLRQTEKEGYEQQSSCTVKL